MGGACSTYEWEERCIQGFGVETCKEKNTWKTQTRMKSNNKMDIQEVADMEFIHLVQDNKR